MLADFEEPSEKKDRAFRVRNESDGVEPLRDLAEFVTPLRAQRDERACAQRGELSAQESVCGVEVFQEELFVAREVAVDLLILGRDVEDGEIGVVGEAG